MIVDFQPSVNQQQLLDFQSLRFIQANYFLGVGKTHLATAIGITSAKKHLKPTGKPFKALYKI